MAGFSRFKEVVDAQSFLGKERMYTWRKTVSQATTIGVWFDLAMSPGNPTPKYWFDVTPLNATQIKQSTDGGLFHGANVTPQNKYLRELMAMLPSSATPLPMPMILCDYLMYYPTIDETVTDTQFMTNAITLPRYTNGEGVRIMAVTIAGRTGGQTFTVSYTNSLGVSGRTTQLAIENSVSVVGSIATSDRAVLNQTSGPFLNLQANDTGVRSIESVTMNGADVGIFSLVLVKPLAQMQIRGIDAPVEKDFLRDHAIMPQIFDDAYLNFLCLPQGSLSGLPIHGIIKTSFN